MPVHAAMGRGWSSSAGRVLSGAVIGPLAGLVGPGLVDEVLAECGAVQRRFRRLPARFGVYFVLGLCLFRGLGYPAVLRQLVAGLEQRLAGAGWEFPSPTALSRLRGRLGEAPFAALLGRAGLAAGLGWGTWVEGVRPAGGGVGRDGAGGPGQRGERCGAGPAARRSLPAGQAGGAGGVRDPGRAGRGAGGGSRA